MLFFRWSWIVIMILAFAVGAGAGAVYSWTDENGVRVFSDTPPADGAKDLVQTDKIVTDETENQKSKAAYNRMVEQAKRQAMETNEAAQEQKDRTAARRKAQENDAITEKRNAEMQRLRAEIAKIRARGLGPNFTQGMKDNMIKQIKEQMAALSNTP